MPLLEAIQVSKTYESKRGQRHVLEDVNFAVEEGEFVSIVGYSGSGKSTLIGILSGLIPPSSGQVLIHGEQARGFAPRASIVFQNYSLLPWMSTFENVRLAVQAAFPAWTRERQAEQSLRYLEMVGLKAAVSKRPGQLSGGMRQRVAIARAFAVEPELMFLDEPFGALDALTRGTLQSELAAIRMSSASRTTVVMITNSVEEAIVLSDRVVPLSMGPRATPGPAIPVELAYPRTREMLTNDPAAARVEAKVVEYLTGFAHRPSAPGVDHEAMPMTAVLSGSVNS